MQQNIIYHNTFLLYNRVSVWGDHCHHGYFESYSSKKTPYEAQIALVEKLLTFGGVRTDTSPKNMQIIDIGCGVGGSSRYLRKKFSESNAHVTAINISDRQLELAKELTAQETIETNDNDNRNQSKKKRNNNSSLGKISFLNRNAMDTKFNDNSFDLVWSCESAEHMPDHFKFLKECYRILNINGNLLIATWCCKKECKLNSIDKIILKLVDRYFNNSLKWISLETYSKHLETIEYKEIQFDEWTRNVSIFWIYVLKSIFTRKGLYAMFCQGNSYLWYSIISVIFMWIGLAFGTIKFVVISAKK